MVTTSPTGARRSLRQCHNDEQGSWRRARLQCSCEGVYGVDVVFCISCAVVVVGWGCTLRFWLVGIPPRSSPCAQRSPPCHLRVRVRVRVRRYSVRVCPHDRRRAAHSPQRPARPVPPSVAPRALAEARTHKNSAKAGARGHVPSGTGTWTEACTHTRTHTHTVHTVRQPMPRRARA
jgi:hypothetical protein